MRRWLILIAFGVLSCSSLPPVLARTLNTFEDPQEITGWQAKSTGAGFLAAERSLLAASEGRWGVSLSWQKQGKTQLAWERSFPVAEDWRGQFLVLDLRPSGELPQTLALVVKTGYGDFLFGPLPLKPRRWQTVKIDPDRLGLGAETVLGLGLKDTGSGELAAGEYLLYLDNIRLLSKSDKREIVFSEKVIDDLTDFQWGLDGRRLGDIGQSRISWGTQPQGRYLQVDYEFLGSGDDWLLVSRSGQWDLSSAQEFIFQMKGDGSGVYIFVWFIDAESHLAIYGPHGSNKDFLATNTDWRTYTISLGKDKPVSDNGLKWDKVTLIGFMVNDNDSRVSEAQKGTLLFTNLKLRTDPRALELKKALSQSRLPVEVETGRGERGQTL